MGTMERKSHKGHAPTSVRQRIEESVVVDPGGCWIWQKSSNAAGYGQIWIGSRADGTRRSEKAHRAAYIAFRGEIPAGLVLDHLCRNTACCNPFHVEPVTQQENLLRGETVTARNAAKSHCPRGHEYTAGNTRIYGRKRYCIACNDMKHALARAERPSHA